MHASEISFALAFSMRNATLLRMSELSPASPVLSIDFTTDNRDVQGALSNRFNRFCGPPPSLRSAVHSACSAMTQS